MAISDTKLRNILGKVQEPCILSHRDSLQVKVSAKGTLSWQYRCRYAGKQVILTLGRYPGISIKDAQDYIPVFQQWLNDDKDPRVEYKNKNIDDTGGLTLEELTHKWVEKKIPEFKEKTQGVYINHANKWIFGHFDCLVDNMELSQWFKYFDKVKIQGSAKTAGVSLTRIKTIIAWGVKRGLVKDNNPVMRLIVKDVGEKAEVGERVLLLDEVAKIWLAIERSQASPATKMCLQLIFITGARQSEVRTARWHDFNFDSMIWTVPKENSKSGKEISRPISTKMNLILDQLGLIYGRTGFLIPGRAPNTAMTTHSINRYCARIWAVLFDKHNIAKFTPHDSRRTISTRLSEKEVMPHVTEKMLGHAMQGVMAVYNKHDWIKEQLSGYELYWQLIEKSIQEELNK